MVIMAEEVKILEDRRGGGGGSGSIGGDWNENHPGYGGNGVDFSYIFGKNIGENGYIAGGGGGGGYIHDSNDSLGIGGLGRWWYKW